MGMSYKHRAFIDSFFLHNQNATAAYCDVYGVNRESGRRLGCKLLTNIDIVAEINRRRAELGMQADEIIERLSDEARADMGDFMDIESMGAQINLYKAKQLGLTHLIKKVKQKTTTIVTKAGDEIETHQIEIELADSQAAKTILAKHRGLLVDRIENLNIDLATLTDEQLEMIKQGKSITDVLKRTST